MALTINGEQISDRMLDRELLRLSSGLEMDAPEAGGIDPAQLRSAALHTLIDRTLLLQLAASRKLRVTASDLQTELIRRWGVQRSSACDPGAMDTIREDLLLSRVQADMTRHVPRPGRTDVERFYRANLNRYRLPEAVEAAHILRGFTEHNGEQDSVNAMEQANEELRRGVPFGKVADRYSDCKGVGGSVGWVTRGAMVQEFEDVIFALVPHQFSPVFRTVFGFHIAMVTRHRRAGVAPLDQVKLEIAKRLHDQARSAALQQMLARIRAESDIHYTEGSAHA